MVGVLLVYLCIVKRLNKNVMKEMFTTLKEVYNEDPKEFVIGMLFGIFMFLMTWFMFWFYGTFCYDL